MKYIWWTLFLLVITLVFVWKQWPSQHITMTVCDVGQGDAILFTMGFSQLLVDTGPPGGAVLSCLSNHMPFWDRHLEVVMVTHADNDHSGSLSLIVDSFRIGQLYTTEHSEPLLSKLLGNTQVVSPLWQGHHLLFGSLKGEVLWPPHDFTTSNSNRTSLVFLLDAGRQTVMMMGDADAYIEKSLLSAHLYKHATLLKISHHGSGTSTSSEFLDAIQPALAIISVGKNSYGHPSKELLERLSTKGIEVKRTDLDGSVAIDLSQN